MMTTLLGYTWVGWLNHIVLQWFFVRLAYSVCAESGTILEWRILGPIVPLTGWWSDFVYIGTRRSRRIR